MNNFQRLNLLEMLNIVDVNGGNTYLYFINNISPISEKCSYINYSVIKVNRFLLPKKGVKYSYGLILSSVLYLISLRTKELCILTIP